MKNKVRKHYHDKAVQAGEQYGACYAESLMYPKDSAEYILWRQRMNIAYEEMFQNAIEARNFVETPDYES